MDPSEKNDHKWLLVDSSFLQGPKMRSAPLVKLLFGISRQYPPTFDTIKASFCDDMAIGVGGGESNLVLVGPMVDCPGID